LIDKLHRIVTDVRTERAITALIILNAIILGLETSPRVMQAFGPALEAIDAVILGVFVIEILARIAVFRFRFFRDPWSIFDFFVVGIALVPATEAFSVLRTLRVLRVLRLITTMPSLRRVVGGLITALPGMGSIVMLLAVLYYVFSVMATRLFGAVFPDWFGTIGASAYSLFQIMTLESWSMGIVRPVMEKFPYAWAFFVPYIVVTTFAVLNLFIGVVVNAMQTEHQKAADEELAAEREMMHEETTNVLEEVRKVQADLAALRQEIVILLGQRTG
jgi:voltage-gated sodium channel